MACVGTTESGSLCKARGAKHGPFGDLCKRHFEKYEIGAHIESLGKRCGHKGAIWVRFKKTCDENRKLRALGRKIMGLRILYAFRRAISDPSYKMCRDRLMCEFHSDF